ncbi:MAG: radical SAM family heme chaperone HemW [Syntrophomonadaceae bacterium]|nr:radical SAM family heme chaperone HemW [Syntrophomonadaceae bacterium]
MITTGLYIHYPFCVRKCSYCDFYSVPFHRESSEAYLQALMQELSLTAETRRGVIKSIYLGGGTPSLIEPAFIESLLAGIQHSFEVGPECEITIEMNPGTSDPDRLKSYKRAGINRVSLGVQSLHNEELQILGRVHSRDQVLQAVEWINQAGFENYGLDLIYGIPGQTMTKWLATLQGAADLKPRHLSCYLLQMENTVPLEAALAEGRWKRPDEEEEADMYYAMLSFLHTHNYQHYEISNFCSPGFSCVHNLNYWEGGSYIGLGAGAVSFWEGQRYENTPEISAYIENLSRGAGPPYQVLESLDGTALAADAMIMGLRMTRGINITHLSRRLGLDVMELFHQSISIGLEEGLLELNGPWLRLTQRGYFLSNRVFIQMLDVL